MKNGRKLSALILVLLLIPVIAGNVWCALQVHQLAKQRAVIKNDYSYLNDIRFGLLSVTAWRDHIKDIVNDRIENFNVTPEQKVILTSQISKVLNALITKADSTVQHSSNSLNGKIRKFAINTFVNWDDLRKQVPAFTQTIIDEIKKPANKEKLKGLAEEKVNQYAEATYDSLADTTKFKNLLLKYHAADLRDFDTKSAASIDSLQRETYQLTFVIIGTMLLFLLLWLPVYKFKHLRKPLFVLSVLLALVVLIIALSSPMIEIDARIHQLDFVMLGEHIKFEDQVIFYQSKSILDVVRILLKTGKGDSVFVGILILIFSVIFPITKLLATEVHLLGGEKIKRNKLVTFFAFHSGKWSMADVMVIAIFMAYVGFKGILDNQLQVLNYQTPTLTSIATNLTSLQPGFILFVAFVLFSLTLSEILKRISGRKKVPVAAP